MAFREKHPNVISPIYSPGTTWSDKPSEEEEDEKVEKVLFPDSILGKENEPPSEALVDSKKDDTNVSKEDLNTLKKEEEEWILAKPKKRRSSRGEGRPLQPLAPPIVSSTGRKTRSTKLTILNDYGRASQKHRSNTNKYQGSSTSKKSGSLRSFGTNDDMTPVKKGGDKVVYPPFSNQKPRKQYLNFAQAVGTDFVANDQVLEPFIPCPPQVQRLSDEEKPSLDTALTLSNYTSSIRAWAHSKEPDGPEHAEFILRDMLTMYYAGTSEVRPDGGCYNLVIYAYAGACKPTKAEAVLRLMWDDYNHGNKLAEPNTRIYTSVLYAWEKSKENMAPERCEIILKKMHELHESGLGPDCKPDLYTYTVCLHCWADSNRKDAANRAEQLFRQMNERYLAGDEGLRPDKIAYSNLMNAYAASEHSYARAEDILWKMVDDFLSGNEKAKPIVRTFNTVLAIWSKSQASQAPERAEAIISVMHELNKKGALDVKPDKYSYSLVLKSWAQSNRRDAAERAEAALNWMMDLYEAGDKAAQPDLIKYTTCISSLAHSGKPERADALLHKMLKDYMDGAKYAKPDNKCFNTVLAGWSRDRGPDAADRAEAILRRMWALFELGELDVQPDIWMYNTIIFCWKNANNPERAEMLLDEMEHKFEIGALMQGPDATTFRAVIQAWRQSQDARKYARLEALEHRFQKLTDPMLDEHISKVFGSAFDDLLG